MLYEAEACKKKDRNMPPRAVTEFARSMENNFETSKYWEFERILGLGSFGVTILLKEREHAVEHRKRIALKLAQVGGVKQLENEIKWLRVSLPKLFFFFTMSSLQEHLFVLATYGFANMAFETETPWRQTHRQNAGVLRRLGCCRQGAREGR